MKKKVWFFLMTALFLILGPAGALANISSTFDTDAEGWSVFNDAYPVEYQSSGGNPDGYITARDKGLGQTWYFNAPSKFLGNLSSYIGGTLSYDIILTVKSGSYYNAVEVYIEGTAQTLAWNASPDPNPPVGTWTSFSVPLTPASFIVDAGVFNNVMANVTGLKIRGEYISGGDTEGLDNVLLTAVAAPIPGAFWLLGSGLVGLIGLRKKFKK